MHGAGVWGMNRRVADYTENLATLNQFLSVSAFILAASFFVFVYNMATSWARGRAAEANPWRAKTLEWQTSSPPPLENFPASPTVVGYPYDYGVPGSIHAVIPVTGGAAADNDREVLNG
jgi:cytochrome c oxidase subunit 1